MKEIYDKSTIFFAKVLFKMNGDAHRGNYCTLCVFAGYILKIKYAAHIICTRLLGKKVGDEGRCRICELGVTVTIETFSEGGGRYFRARLKSRNLRFLENRPLKFGSEGFGE